MIRSKKLSSESIKALALLKLKTENHKMRMPSIKSIHRLLTELGIEHRFNESVNTVERRTKGRRYVNSRYEGKRGYKLEIPRAGIVLDTSDSHYSFNTWAYAADIIKHIKEVA